MAGTMDEGILNIYLYFIYIINTNDLQSVNKNDKKTNIILKLSSIPQ